MTQYQITLSDEIVHGLFREDSAMARLVEQVLDQVLQSEVTEALQAKPFERPRNCAEQSSRRRQCLNCARGWTLW